MSRKPITVTQRTTIAALEVDNRSLACMSRETGLSRQTCKKVLNDDATKELVEQFSQEMGTRMLNLADSIVCGIDEETVQKAALRDRVVAAGILTDKGRGAFGLDKQGPMVNINVIQPVDLSKYY